MFGKLASVLAYFKALEVYVVKRYPTAKLPIWGMVFTYAGIYFLASRYILCHKTNRLRQLRLHETHNIGMCPFPGYWSFNRNYYYNPYFSNHLSPVTKGKKCPITGRTVELN
jgi:hypothetical protein